MRKIVLASNSQSRKYLLSTLGIKFESYPSNIDEKKISISNPSQLVKKLSLLKALSIAPKFDDAIIISADTVTAFRGKIIGKPSNEEEAYNILKSLSNDKHYAYTGYTIIDTKSGKKTTKVVKTKVYFRELSDSEIKQYINTKEPLNKAGAYAIQSLGGLFVKRIEGDFYNIIGLPLNSLFLELQKFGVSIYDMTKS